MKKLFIPVLLIIILVQFALLVLGPGYQDVYPRVFIDGDSYVVEIVDEDMVDDSVRATKYRIDLSSDEFGIREIADQSSTWACWPGRGHEDFSDERCE
jgi:hypothetical protein